MSLSLKSVLTAPNMKMPIVGLGTWQEEFESTIDVALHAGYRHFDTATLYSNEQVVGKGIKKWIDSNHLARDDVFVTTKIPLTHMRPEHIEKALRESLEKLQLSYVDLYLIHQPMGMQFSDELFPMSPNGEWLLDKSTDLIACWKTMEGLVDAGLTKSIGLSNFNIEQIQRILKSCRIKPANLQIELYVYLQQPELVNFCRDNEITVCAYSPIGSPYLKAQLSAGGMSDDSMNIHAPMVDPVVVQIAKTHGKTPSQVLLRYLIQLGVAVIPKSSNAERIKANINIFDFKLSAGEMNNLKALDKGEDGRQFGTKGPLLPLSSHPEYPFPR